MRLALECRRRVKEQQKRIGTAEFRNTQFSYTLGKDGVEKFVVTPELQSEDHIGRDPLPPGQVWAHQPRRPGRGLGPVPDRGHRRTGQRRPHPEPPGAPGVRRERSSTPSRTSTPGPRNWSATATPASTSSRSSCGPSTPRKGGSSLGVAALLAMCAALLGKSLRGGLVVVGGLNLGGSHRPAAQRHRRGRTGGREGCLGRADAGLGPEAALRPVRRHGHQGQRAVLRRRPRGAASRRSRIDHPARNLENERFVGVPEQGGRDLIASDPLAPGFAYTASFGADGTVGLFRIKVSASAGTGCSDTPPTCWQLIRLYRRLASLPGA